MIYCGDASMDQQYLELLGSVAAGGPDGEGALRWRRRAANSAFSSKMVAPPQNNLIVFPSTDEY